MIGAGARALVAAAATLGPLGCDGSGTEVQFPSVTGEWITTSPNNTGWNFSFTLNEAPDGSVSGTGRDVDSPAELIVGSARHAFPRLTLPFSIVNRELQFVGVVSSDGNTIVGDVVYQSVRFDLVFERLQ